MKTEYAKINISIQILQVVLWIAFYMCFPLFTCLQMGDFSNFGGYFKAFAQNCLLYPSVLYFLNFYLLVPRLLFKGRWIWFLAVNLLVLLPLDKIPAFLWVDFPDNPDQTIYFRAGLAFVMMIEIGVILTAATVRYILRWNEMLYKLKEKEQKDAEAELTWLKNQLNPHFLFNTLNNISSLVQIDADTAQENIGRLSELLRYALYDSNQPKVPVEKEVEFIRNYIDLMRLRSDTTTVRLHVAGNVAGISIIPLLFISPVENAFKHSASSREPSAIDIDIRVDAGGSLVLSVSNSYHPRTDARRIGSGIGVENLRRRLELAYAGNYSYSQQIENGKYQVTITICNCQ